MCMSQSVPCTGGNGKAARSSMNCFYKKKLWTTIILCRKLNSFKDCQKRNIYLNYGYQKCLLAIFLTSWKITGSKYLHFMSMSHMAWSTPTMKWHLTDLNCLNIWDWKGTQSQSMVFRKKFFPQMRRSHFFL